MSTQDVRLSAFRCKEKPKPCKALQLYSLLIKTLAKLGESWSIDKDILDEVEAFICAMHEWPNFLNVDDLRFYMLNKKYKKETNSSKTNIALSALPPCRESLVQLARRANFQTAILKGTHVPAPYIPKSNDGNGWNECNETPQPLWTEEEEELGLPEAVINGIIAKSDSIKGQESNVPSNYDSHTDFYDNGNDSGSYRYE